MWMWFKVWLSNFRNDMDALKRLDKAEKQLARCNSTLVDIIDQYEQVINKINKREISRENRAKRNEPDDEWAELERRALMIGEMI